ncbi:TfoX/Sxy family protein [Pseudomonas stutzeri]|uniref:TfoX/Sxy family protein n=1 Tax=Pseudomonas TaxID=286 RepID=UPI00051DC34F|nr:MULTISPECIES: TfoX/Sxy family protein [Pseudomonas]KGK82264.1 competence protein TfoX [Stutzerimonas degradans]MCQ4232301.1 TfoX/Sxy family protein [Stutzerimonas degradans]MCQ4267055.1 TfoX/Sxy family protein [Stutzerimonas degradans]OOE15038.1 competence protein TfoX [Stutzerimonas degradans]QCT97546.1 TfoX/Sxy family protein [Stutzerimonas degradans]
MHDELLTLRNLGKTSSQWLHASGIHTAADLRRLGAVGSYRAVKARGFSASRVLLYAIEGALRDLPWQELPTSLKDELNRLLDEGHNKS